MGEKGKKKKFDSLVFSKPEETEREVILIIAGREVFWKKAGRGGNLKVRAHKRKKSGEMDKGGNE